MHPFAKVVLHSNLAFPWNNVSSAQPEDELHFDVHFVGKWGPERSRDSSLGAGAGNPPPAALPGSRVLSSPDWERKFLLTTRMRRQ